MKKMGILVGIILVMNAMVILAEIKDHPIGSVIWQYQISGGWDNSVKAISSISDVDGDGIDDVIACSEDDYIRCFSGGANGTGIVIWEHEIYSGSLWEQNELAIIEDIDGDGHDDIIVGTPWGDRSIIALSGMTGEQIWKHDTHEYGDGGWVYQVDCKYDYSGDGINDVLAATGDDSDHTGPKRIYCLDGLTGNSIWECYVGGPAFSVIGVEDFTGDGQPDVVAGAANLAETMGYAYGINGANGNMVWTFSTSGSVWALEQIDDVNGDGIKDIIIGDFYGNIYGLNAVNGNVIYSNSIGSSSTITRFVKLNDVNGDGHPDIVPAHSTIHVVFAIDGQTGNFIWTHNVADQPWNVARIGDVNGDGINDIVVGTLYNNNYCYFLDGTDGSVITSINYYEAVDAIASIPDVVGDGSMEMMAGGRNGKLTCFSGGMNASVNYPPYPPNINGTTNGIVGEEYEYTFVTTDPDNDSIYYRIDWGDGNITPWIGPFDSGVGCNCSHSWVAAGNYTIKVEAKDTKNAKSDWSSMSVEIVNQISFNISLFQGWNFVTIACENNYTASLLYNSIQGCNLVLKWNNSKNDFDVYTSGSPNNFAIENGTGYFISVSNNTNLSVTGLPIKSVNITLLVGWNSLGWFKEEQTNASDIYNSIAGCNIILKWNNSKDDFDVYVPNAPDFVIEQGNGFFVSVSQQSQWHG